MRLYSFLALMFLLSISMSGVAEAKQKKHYNNSNHSYSKVGPKPDKWCGWFMRTLFGGGDEYNLAANWKKRGSPTKPKIGAIVVWPHHVGVITGKASDGKWVVKSGNDSGRVRERPRSVASAIAFRSL